jgi:hypothetical protein
MTNTTKPTPPAEPTDPVTFDYEGIKQLAADIGRPASTLYALSDHNDPFFVGPARRAKAEWFAGLWIKFGMGAGSHIRRLHYKLISQRKPIKMLDGVPYENTEECWQKLAEASKDARYLDLISVDDFVDRRNAEAVTNVRDNTGEPWLDIEGSDLEMEDMPEPPRAVLEVREQTQHYQLEIWCEKSTMNDVLAPIAERYGANLVTGTGEISTTHCNLCVARAREDGRPVRILYISDFDPAGRSMPVAAARKIEFFVRDGGLDLDIQLRPIVLTPEQCVRYELPRTPIKKSERRAGRFEERFGAGATELDALEALHPGELRRIINREIARYHDADLDTETEAMAEPVHRKLERITVKVHRQHASEIASLRREYEGWAKRQKALWHAIAESLEADATPIVDEVDWPAPKEGNEDRNPLFDSTRSYIEQIDVFKHHQGKPIAGLCRAEAISKGMLAYHARKVKTESTP